MEKALGEEAVEDAWYPGFAGTSILVGFLPWVREAGVGQWRQVPVSPRLHPAG